MAKIEMHPAAISWQDWLSSDEGIKASEEGHIQRQYLENRLHRAFMAGWNALEKPIRRIFGDAAIATTSERMVNAGPTRSITHFEKEYANIRAFAKRHSLRDDWHEPDEQGITVKVIGSSFDNAFGSSLHEFEGKQMEKVVIVEHKESGDKLIVNLASLLALAAEDR